MSPRTVIRSLLPALLALGWLVCGCTASDAVSDDPPAKKRHKGKDRKKDKGAARQGGQDAPAESAAPAAGGASTVTMVLAASFGSGGSCYKTAPEGCDLYEVQYDLGASAVQSAERLTSHAGQAEWFPTIDRTGAHALYEARKGGRDFSVVAVELEGGAERTLVDGRYPDLAHHADEFVYSTHGRELYSAQYAIGGSGITMGDKQGLGEGRDPQYFPDGSQLLYHRKEGNAETETVLRATSGGAITRVSDHDRCAHAAASYSSDVAVCSLQGKLYGRELQGGSWGGLSVMLDPADFQLPDRFGECGRAGFFYPEFCGDDDHLVVSGGCLGQSTWATLLLIDLRTREVVDLHAQLESTLGVSGADSVTAACSAL